MIYVRMYVPKYAHNNRMLHFLCLIPLKQQATMVRIHNKCPEIIKFQPKIFFNYKGYKKGQVRSAWTDSEKDNIINLTDPESIRRQTMGTCVSTVSALGQLRCEDPSIWSSNTAWAEIT